MLRQFSLPIFEQPCWRNNQHWFGVSRVGPQPEQEHECLECLAQTHIVGEQDARQLAPPCFGQPGKRIALVRRSEEHTSELQSLMRISYAVLCLKNKQLPQNGCICSSS